MEGSSGAGCFCLYLKLNKRIPTGSIATLQQPELFAILQLCIEMEWHNCVDETMYISADSQSAIEPLLWPTQKWGMNVSLICASGHEGILGNEKSDELESR